MYNWKYINFSLFKQFLRTGKIVTIQDVLPFVILWYSKSLTPFLLSGIWFVLFTFFYAPVCLSILHSDHCTVVAQVSWERANVHEEVKSFFSAVATKENCRYHINTQTNFLPENYSPFTNFSREICIGWVIFGLFLQKRFGFNIDMVSEIVFTSSSSSFSFSFLEVTCPSSHELLALAWFSGLLNFWLLVSALQIFPI